VSDCADTRAREGQIEWHFLPQEVGRAEVRLGAQINVTPLIDVLLTLIVMFMLVVSMDKEYLERAQIPQQDRKQTASEEQSRTIVIQVVWTTKDEPPAVKINREDVSWENLETRLMQIYLTRAEKVAFVRGDADVDFQYVAEVIDVAHHAGVQRIGLLSRIGWWRGSELRLSGLLSRPVLDPNRSADEPEGVADLILQESLIGKVQFYGTVCEQYERGRRHGSLRHVENLDALAHRNRCALEVDVLEEAVHRRSWNTFAALVGNLLQKREDFLSTFARLCGDEDHRRVGQEL
jgi:biopolymer transport protein TolR